MQDGKNHDPFRFDDEEDAVGEAADERSPNVAVHGWEPCGHVTERLHDLAHVGQVAVAEARALRLYQRAARSISVCARRRSTT